MTLTNETGPALTARACTMKPMIANISVMKKIPIHFFTFIKSLGNFLPSLKAIMRKIAAAPIPRETKMKPLQ